MFHLAQVNIARARAPLTDPLMAEFVGALGRINAVADSARGFAWRYHDASGAAIDTQAFDDPLIIVNLSVWESVEALRDFAYRSDHVAPLRRRAEWFERISTPHLALWWIPIGHRPSLAEARDRLAHLERYGETQIAFTFRRQFARPSDPEPAIVALLAAGATPLAAVPNLDGRRFVPRAKARTGDAGRATHFVYRQEGERVWATYSGGDVRHGMLAARREQDCLVVRYLHAADDGRAKLGTCVSAVDQLADGRLRLRERWCWDHWRQPQTSILEEVARR